MIRKDRRILRGRVHQQHHGPVPRSGALGHTHLVPIGQCHGVAVVAIGDQHRLPGQGLPHALLVVRHPQAMGDALLVQGLRQWLGPPRTLQEVRERWRRFEEHGVDAREVGPDLPDEPETILHRAVRRPLVGDDRASPFLQLHGTDQPTDPSASAVEGETHLVREIRRSRRGDQEPLRPPLGHVIFEIWNLLGS